MRDPLRDILEERAKQDAKWGNQYFRTPSGWLAILGEEYGEVCEAVLEDWSGGYRAELVQVAAVAMAAIESYDWCVLRDRMRDVLTL